MIAVTFYQKILYRMSNRKWPILQSKKLLSNLIYGNTLHKCTYMEI